jgi:phosphatidate phosphatase APP1
MSAPRTSRRWPDAVLQRLKEGVIDADDHLDAMWRRVDTRLGRGLPRHLAAYRGYADSRGVEVMGRVLAEKPEGGPLEDAGWWDNLLDTYRRFESDEVPDVPLRLQYRGGSIDLRSDHEGYWQAAFDSPGPMSDLLWDNAIASLADGTLLTPQPVLQVGPRARFGVISDIDDTILQSSITDWKTAAQLTFLHNARTRKPLAGVAALYRALQATHNPIFYVSSSPWNLYDLLEDFMELNGIPFGPIHLRDLGTDPGKFIKSAGHGHKLERAIHLIERFPQLRWVLLGDSGQADAELYAEAARTHPDRIAAIYIRDVDPDVDSPLDLGVDGHIQRIAGTSVPMLRVADSAAIARHAAGLGLLDAASIAAIDAEVARDHGRPGLGEAALAEAVTPAEPSQPA